MKNNIIDVCVLVVSKPNEEAITDLVLNMSKLTGIIKTNINKKVSNVIDIKYDPNFISGSGIVKFMRKNNCTGALVGF